MNCQITIIPPLVLQMVIITIQYQITIIVVEAVNTLMGVIVKILCCIRILVITATIHTQFLLAIPVVT